MYTARFTVEVDAPPAPPTGLTAAPGDRRVDLAWNANTEPDLVGYRVHRSLGAGGPYQPVADTVLPAHPDTGLTNGVTYYYVVTALDDRFESAHSNEAAATPQAPGGLVAEVRFDPDHVPGECLLDDRCGRCRGDDDDDDDDHDDDHDRDHALNGGGHDDGCDDDDDHDHDWLSTLEPGALLPEGSGTNHGGGGGGPKVSCPEWLYATIELPRGHGPDEVDLLSVRLAGTVRADRRWSKRTDVDADGLRELRVRFGFHAVATLLVPGANVLTVSGRASSEEFAGQATLRVDEPRVDLDISPSKLTRSSKGQDVEAELRVAPCLDEDDVEVKSLRLNETVPVKRVVSSRRDKLIVKFDRAAVLGVLPDGERVEVRVSGTVGGQPFTARDHIRVTR
jgi:hypothetical protein